MKQYLILIGLASTAAASAAQGTLPAAQVSDARPATTRAATPSGPSGPHQLSEQQRAELRRQLREYNRLAGKGS